MGKNADLFFAEPNTKAQETPETPPPMIKTSNMKY
jgi:hypothetical protein